MCPACVVIVIMGYCRSPCRYYSDSYVIVYASYTDAGGRHPFCGNYGSYFVVTKRSRYAYVKFHTSSEANVRRLIGFSYAVFIAEGLFILLLISVIMPKIQKLMNAVWVFVITTV